MLARLVSFMSLMLFSFGLSGCINQILIAGEIESTRRASAAFDTIGDYELARAATQSGLAQFEGMHALAPDNV
ncbi:MAG: hypothetical protein M3O46_21545, partial [Myxococcota bacterium]|nr:hypothetical protein [Myxococcota bacterium]